MYAKDICNKGCYIQHEARFQTKHIVHHVTISETFLLPDTLFLLDFCIAPFLISFISLPQWHLRENFPNHLLWTEPSSPVTLYPFIMLPPAPQSMYQYPTIYLSDCCLSFPHHYTATPWGYDFWSLLYLQHVAWLIVDTQKYLLYEWTYQLSNWGSQISTLMET